MKRIIVAFSLFIFLFAGTFHAFSYDIDGIDTGVEWDGASVYKLVDGESNCGVNFGVVKVKFDYDTSALLLCFLFSDPALTPENTFAGISLTVEDTDFVFDASDGVYSKNIDPYSFDGAIYLDINNGATCEVRVGVKTGLPKSMDCNVRFIDSQGYYSNYYPFTVVNDLYEETDNAIFYPDNNSDDNHNNAETVNKPTKKRKTSTTREDVTIKTSPPYSYTGRTKKIKTEKSTSLTSKATTAKKDKDRVTVIYYEKEIYISEIYVEQTLSQVATTANETIISTESEHSETGVQAESTTFSDEHISLSKGTIYKKIITGIGLTAFVSLACFGAYSAKKNSDKTADDKQNLEE